MTAPCAIEYILVTRWRGGKKGGQNRVCACDTRVREVSPDLLVRVLVELVANYWSLVLAWGGGGVQPRNPRTS